MKKIAILLVFISFALSSSAQELVTKPGAKMYTFYGDEQVSGHIFAELGYYSSYKKSKKVKVLNFASVNDSTYYDAYIVSNGNTKYLVMAEDIEDNSLIKSANKKLAALAQAETETHKTDRAETEANTPNTSIHASIDEHMDKDKPTIEDSQAIHTSEKSLGNIDISMLEYKTSHIVVRSAYATEMEAYKSVLQAMKESGIFPGRTDKDNFLISTDWQIVHGSNASHSINASIYSLDGVVYMDFSGKYKRKSSTTVSLLLFGFTSFEQGAKQAVYNESVYSKIIFSEILSIVNRLQIQDFKTIKAPVYK